MPDEYLPPNKILFLQNLPESVTKDQLFSLFSQLGILLLMSFTVLKLIHALQISKSARSASHPNKKGYCFRGIYRRRKCGCRERCTSQLQIGWGEQDQGLSPWFLTADAAHRIFIGRLHLRGNDDVSILSLGWDIVFALYDLNVNCLEHNHVVCPTCEMH